MVNPIQYALKFPVVRPDRILRDAPPSREELTMFFTKDDSVEVKILTNSGIIAPARVPQVMIVASFHQIVPSPMCGMSRYDARNVNRTETSEVIQTSDVKGASKFILSTFSYFLWLMNS